MIGLLVRVFGEMETIGMRVHTEREGLILRNWRTQL